MKALTLTQPWATLVYLEAKLFETRSWGVKYRGPLGIHAAKSFPSWARQIAMTSPFREVLRAAGYRHSDDLPVGQVLCIVDLLSMYPTHAIRDQQSAQEIAFGDWSPGRLAWELGNVRRLERPITVRGAQGLWNWQGGERWLEGR